MDKLVSIVIPVYRAEETIERCVRSLLNGTYENIEILLIEDCGGDRSLELCRQLSREDSRVKVYANPQNAGVSHTRNVGLAHASGEYLMFVDSDDWVEPDFVRTMTASAAPGVMPVCGYFNQDELHNGRMDICIWNPENVDIPLETAVELLYQKNLLQQIWNKLFILPALREQKILFDESISLGEDTRFVLAYLQACNIHQIQSVGQPLYHYMRDQSSGLMYRVGYEGINELLKNLTTLYTIAGLSPEEAAHRVSRERQHHAEIFAYLIMHNAGMPLREKRRLILQIDKSQGRRLYVQQLVLWMKERIRSLFPE